MTTVLEHTRTTELVGRARWQLGPEIGRGASGRTHMVTCEGRTAVAKIMTMKEAQGWKSVDLFQREVVVLESLAHPGIPRFIDHIVLDEGATLALVMERAPGATLHEHLRTTPATPAQLRAWLERGLEVLDYLHGRTPPIVHRDVTTRNLMVDGEHLSLIDFGSVKATLRESTIMTDVGTFGFMAPEQIMGRPLAVSDLYGLGVSILCAAARCQPHELPTRGDDGSIDVARVPNLGALAPVLTRLTRPGLDARYRSAADALAELRLIPSERAVAAARETALRGDRMAAAIALFALAAGVLVLFGPKEPVGAGVVAGFCAVYGVALLIGMLGKK